MFNWRHHFPLVFLSLMVFLGWVGNATAHRRGGLPLNCPVPPPATQPTNPEVEKIAGPLSLKPELYWEKLMVLKKAGEFEGAFKSGMALINVFPQASQRGEALLELAELAKGKGDIALAQELYSLVPSLVPGSPEAAQACLEACVLEISQNLSQDDPLQALRHFLERVNEMPSGYSPETLQTAVRKGWQAMHQKVQAIGSPPLTLVENMLALWDMQPPGMRPPEAACLLADLLKKYGLMEEAQNLLVQAGGTMKGDQRNDHQKNKLDLAWLSKGFPGMANFLEQVPEGEKKQVLLHNWLTREHPGVESPSLHVKKMLDWFLPQQANAWWDGPLPSLEPSLKHRWVAPFETQFQADLARSHWAKNQFSQAAQMSQRMADQPLRPDLSPFYQDRLGLSRLKEGRTDAAQKTFQDLAQHNDPFWRRLAQVRLTDLELSRLQAETSP